MSFITEPIPRCFQYGLVAETAFRTIVSEALNKEEQRTQQWIQPRLSFDGSYAIKTQDDALEVKAHFMMARGRLHTFLFRDLSDYQVSESEGLAVQLSPGVFQLVKRYGSGAYVLDRSITRPSATGFAPERGGVPIVAGGGAGQYVLDEDTGQITIQPDQSRSITSHAVGATHQFTLASAFSPNVVNGNTIYVSGVTGSAAALLNNQALTVTAVAGGVVSVNRNTTGQTATGGTATRRIAASEITWAGEFDVLCRYDMDRLPLQAVSRSGPVLMVQADGIRIIEVPEESQ